MQILYTSTAYPPSTGGAQTHIHRIAAELSARHGVQVVSHWDHNRTDWLLGTTLRAPTVGRDYAIDGVPVHRIGLTPWEKLGLAPYVPLYYPLMGVALPAIAAAIARHLAPFAAAADLIHNVRMGREGLSQASFDLARQRGVPFVLTPVHHPRWVGWRYRAYLRLYAAADAVIALTEAERRVLIGLGVPEERVVVTGHGPVLAPRADGAGFRARHGLGDGPIVLFLGQHYAYKGFRQLLQAAPLVWRRVPEARFVFIGPAVKGSERAFAAAPDPRVLRLGSVGLQEKTDALAACALLCVPSSQESFGGVYTEAWSLGRPVIGCPIPAVAEVIEDGVDGLLAPQEPAPIAERVVELLRDPARAAAMGEAGRRKVEARYSWPRIAALTEEAYERLLRGAPLC
jgi:glycosyltransferase involved in cell wall biosynthesis